MDEIVALIAELVDEGLAYPVEGDVYFRVASYPDYGRLSGQRPDQVAEQEPNALKEDPRDFALWKATKQGEDTFWESPWGQGRPGWHIECSAMAEKILGREFEIHGGGLDLVFPHHENELAQSRSLGHRSRRSGCTTGCSRFTRREDVEVASATSSRFATCSSEWGRETRSPLLPHRALAQAARLLRRTMASRAGAACGGLPQRVPDPRQPAPDGPRGSAFADALEDDFNTPAALAVLHEWRCPRPAAPGARDLRARVARRSTPRRRPRSSSWPSASRQAVAARLRRGRPPSRRDRGRRLGRARRGGRARLPDSSDARDAARSSTGGTPSARRSVAAARCSRCG